MRRFLYFCAKFRLNLMLPLDFIDYMRSTLGEEAESLFRALEQEPVTSIRLNDKIDTLTFSCDIDEVPWHYDGYYLSERPRFTLDPLFHAGCYYVQEASSMFLQQVLDEYVPRDAIVLDLCAAPGGKSTILSQHLADEGLLISNEVVRQRVFILSENIQKWGNGNVVVTHNKPSDFGDGCRYLFDCILVDAPCSGEGMFRKDPAARSEWSLDNVEMCAERQKSILEDVWDALKPGGVLIYSTCTFNKKENEDNVRWMTEYFGADILPLTTEPEWKIKNTPLGCHFYPHLTRGEGFFIAALRKPDTNFTPFRIRTSKKQDTTIKADLEPMLQWLKEPQQWEIKQSDRFMTAYPARHKPLIDFITGFLTCISVGFGLGELRGKNIAPQHSLSMSKALNPAAFPQFALTEEQALAFLRTEALLPPDGMPMGTVLLTYDGVPLGFAKNVGNRLNNLYPNEWRIRKL